MIAESDAVLDFDNNHYFPHDALKKDFFQASSTNTICPWKGTASYYSVVVEGQTNADAAWYYPDPKEAAADIKNYVAFWKGVTVEP